jgi:prohibitin 2
VIAIVFFIIVISIFSAAFIIPPGNRGVLVTMGKVSPIFAPEGLGFKPPFITHVIPISIRQQTKIAGADCYSSDLQQISIETRCAGFKSGLVPKVAWMRRA